MMLSHFTRRMASTIVGPKETSGDSSSYAEKNVLLLKFGWDLSLFWCLAASFVNSFSISILSHLVFLLGIGAAF